MTLIVWPVVVRGEITLSQPDQQAPIRITAAAAARWEENGQEIWLLRGSVELQQGQALARSSQAVLTIRRSDPHSNEPSTAGVYLEGDVRLEFRRSGQQTPAVQKPDEALAAPAWWGEFRTNSKLEVSPVAWDAPPRVKPSICLRAEQARSGGGSRIARSDASVTPASHLQEEVAKPPVPGELPAPQAGFRRVLVRPRSAVPLQARWFPSPNGPERIAVIENGVNILVQGIDRVGTLDISADRIVVWTGEMAGDVSGGGGNLQREGSPLEFYLEGNIVFRQGDRVVYAERMYYDVRGQNGIILTAEILTPVPEYQGLVRLKADVLRQLDKQHFQAYNAAVTSSRMGVPKYWIQAENIDFQDIQSQFASAVSGAPVVDPRTGEAAVQHDFLATAKNNFVYLEGIPVLYWPTIATDLTKSNYYIDGLKVKSDRIFGQQIYVDWDVYQLLGVRQPWPGTKWDISTDYLSKRGPAGGTNFRYEGQDGWLLPGAYRGNIDVWGLLRDHGLDNLSLDRSALVPEETLRGRILGQHRQDFGNGWQLSAEVGLISDRNFLEEYYRSEWDELKDQTTGLELKKLTENRSLSIALDKRVNSFFTDADQARVDHFWLGEVLFDRLTWHEHSQVGYFKLHTLSTPADPADLAKFNPLRWEPLDGAAPGNREGVRAATRQELDLPFEMGPVKVVPYILGEAAFWGEDLNGNNELRGTGQVGLRASLPMWRADNSIQSVLFNVNGLAHKMVLEADAYWTDSSQALSRQTLYDPLDDNNIEAFRRRFVDDSFGGALLNPDSFLVPLKFDERQYALRSGLFGNVASPATEIADDLQVVRLGLRQRLQTKRGLPGEERIVDWMTLDLQTSLFPDSKRDNFGQIAGLTSYNFEWHVGDRLTIASDGIFDFFSQGQHVVTVGAFIDRPERLNAYFGFRSIEGPVTSNIVSTTIGYRLSEKWIVSLGSSYDFAAVGNIGQTLKVVRIGESFFTSLGFHIDTSRHDVGINFAIEPRFLSNSKLGQLGGVQIPPAGVFGLE